MEFKVLKYEFFGLENGNINSFSVDAKILELGNDLLYFKIILYQGQYLISFMEITSSIRYNKQQSWFTTLKPLAICINDTFKTRLGKNKLLIDIQYRDDDLLRWIKRDLG